MALLAPADLPCGGVGFAHQLAGADLAGRKWLQIAWSLLYTYAFALVLRWRVLQPLFQFWRHRLRVEEVRQESPDVVSVLDVRAAPDELRAQPGQFFRWRFLTRRHGTRRIRSRCPLHPPATGCGSPSRHAVTVRGRSWKFRSAPWCLRKGRTVH